PGSSPAPDSSWSPSSRSSAPCPCRTSSSSASASPSRSSSTPPWCGPSCCPLSWPCSAGPTGGCRPGCAGCPSSATARSSPSRPRPRRSSGPRRPSSPWRAAERRPPARSSALLSSAHDPKDPSAMYEFSVVGGKAAREIISASRQDIVDVVRDTYLAHHAGDSVNPDSYFLRFPDKPDARIVALPAHLGADADVSGIKWISSFPANIDRGIPRASAALLLNDHET